MILSGLKQLRADQKRAIVLMVVFLLIYVIVAAGASGLERHIKHWGPIGPDVASLISRWLLCAAIVSGGYLVFVHAFFRMSRLFGERD